MSRWVLLRGLTREQRHWGTFAQTFAEAVRAADVIALDLPGNGALHREPSPWTVPAMATHARRALHARGIAPPYHLLAMSLGAMVATAWAAAHPDEVAAAVLINTSMRPFSPLHHRLRPANWGRLLRLLLVPGTSNEDWERAILSMTSRRPQPPDALLAAWVAYRRESPVAAVNALRQLLAAARFHAPLARPIARVLVVASEGDGLVDPRCSAQLAAQWQAPLAAHPWAGHDLPLDDAPWLASQVAAWLRGMPSDTAAARAPTDAPAPRGSLSG